MECPFIATQRAPQSEIQGEREEFCHGLFFAWFLTAKAMSLLNVYISLSAVHPIDPHVLLSPLSKECPSGYGPRLGYDKLLWSRAVLGKHDPYWDEIVWIGPAHPVSLPIEVPSL
jgi:hypothetical protein